MDSFVFGMKSTKTWVTLRKKKGRGTFKWVSDKKNGTLISEIRKWKKNDK